MRGPAKLISSLLKNNNVTWKYNKRAFLAFLRFKFTYLEPVDLRFPRNCYNEGIQDVLCHMITQRVEPFSEVFRLK